MTNQLYTKSFPENMSLQAAFYDKKRRKKIRRIYLAMVAEYDSMVGEYVDAVEVGGFSKNTIIILTSDHGDMRMEHQQFYKMVCLFCVNCSTCRQILLVILFGSFLVFALRHKLPKDP
jgi:membrane-anchored protein YejM (alkaline phosphatase superfamily)